MPFILTQPQFIASRALAREFSHTWGHIEGIILDPEAIHNSVYSQGLAQRGDWNPGITSPTMDGQNVVHITGTGRLSWEVDPDGHVTLQVFRPGSSIGEKEDVEVARLQVFNEYDSDSPFQVAGILMHTSTSPDSVSEGEWPDNMGYHEGLRDDVLFERHVDALVPALAALLAASEEGTQARDFFPAATECLAPLYSQCLPSPLNDIPRRENEVLPDTYWDSRWEYPLINGIHHDMIHVMEVCHRNERFPVESERTAVYAVLALQHNPQRSLLEVIREAILAHTYRPSYE